MKLKDWLKQREVFLKLHEKLGIILTKISPKLNTQVMYYISSGNKLNFDKPLTMDEKISWLKLHNYNTNDLVIQCADKIRVRDYLEDIGKGDLLSELYGTYNSIAEINLAELPEQFALKWNTGAHGNFICLDKNDPDVLAELVKLQQWGDDWKRRKPYLASAEMHYGEIEPRLLCEEYLGTENHPYPDDYKFYCFNGRAEMILMCLGRYSDDPKYYYFDRDWNLLPAGDAFDVPADFKIDKPDFIDEMFELADELAQPFPFVRPDFYYIDGKIMFGELTFTPTGGIDSSITYELNLELGKLLTI